MLGFALNQRWPTVFDRRVYAGQRGLLSSGPDIDDGWRRAASYVDKLIKGAKPADLPVEQPTRFDLIVNLRTAQALGLTIPQSVLQQPTELIQ